MVVSRFKHRHKEDVMVKGPLHWRKKLSREMCLAVPFNFIHEVYSEVWIHIHIVVFYPYIDSLQVKFRPISLIIDVFYPQGW